MRNFEDLSKQEQEEKIKELEKLLLERLDVNLFAYELRQKLDASFHLAISRKFTTKSTN